MKDSTNASRMCFVLASMQAIGLRSYPGCFSDSPHCQGKTLVFSLLTPFFDSPMVLTNEFLHEEEFSVDSVFIIL
jgi:hypothetical protein